MGLEKERGKVAHGQLASDSESDDAAADHRHVKLRDNAAMMIGVGVCSWSV